MTSWKDQLQRDVELTAIPNRIVSLVPSQTELLHSLGLEKQVVGITRFCVHPPQWLKEKTIIGGTKNIDIDKINRLQPDLIIANKEENIKEQVEALQSIAPVYVSDVTNLPDALDMIHQIAAITGTIETGEQITYQVRKAFDAFENNHAPLLSAAYLIWRKPYMTVGGDTFIHDMLTRCKLQNVFGDELRYPQVSIEQLAAMQPSIVILSSEPYPFKQKHSEEIQAQLPGAVIVLADGEMFSWYGSRLIFAADYFRQLQIQWNRMILKP